MKGQGNSNVILGILMAIAFISIIGYGFSSSMVEMNCQNVDWNTWNIPSSGSQQGFGQGASSGTPAVPGTGIAYTLGAKTPNTASLVDPANSPSSEHYSNLMKGMSPACSGSIGGSALITLVLGVFIAIFVVFVVLHWIPFAGMGSD